MIVQTKLYIYQKDSESMKELVSQLSRRIISVGVIVIVLVTVFFLGNYTTPKITTTSSTTIYQTTTETATTTFTLYPNSQPWHSVTTRPLQPGETTAITRTIAITTTTVTSIERLMIENVHVESPTKATVNVTNMGNVNVAIADVLLNGKSLSTVNGGVPNPSLPFNLEAGRTQAFTLTFSSPLPSDTYFVTIATFISSEEALEIVRQIQGWSVADLASFGTLTKLYYIIEEEGWVDLYTVDRGTGKIITLEQSLSRMSLRGYFWLVLVSSSLGAVFFWIDAVNATVAFSG